MSRGPVRPTRSQLTALRRSDPALADLMARTPRYPGFPDTTRARRETHFGALFRAILYQQLAGKAASTIHGRVVALTPGPSLPRPEQVLTFAESGALRAAGVSGNKQRALVDLAERTLDGSLRLAAAARLPDETLIERLVQVRGIGVWSAQMFLMFRLGRLDVMPDGDLGVQEGLRRLDGLDQRPAPAELAERARTWAPLRSVAAWHLWRATELTD